MSIFNDLKGCYDIVTSALNTVATWRIILSKKVAIYHAKTLRKMKQHIRINFGVSKETIQWDEGSNLGRLEHRNGGGCVSWHT